MIDLCYKYRQSNQKIGAAFQKLPRFLPILRLIPRTPNAHGTQDGLEAPAEVGQGVLHPRRQLLRRLFTPFPRRKPIGPIGAGIFSSTATRTPPNRSMRCFCARSPEKTISSSQQMSTTASKKPGLTKAPVLYPGQLRPIRVQPPLLPGDICQCSRGPRDGRTADGLENSSHPVPRIPHALATRRSAAGGGVHSEQKFSILFLDEPNIFAIIELISRERNEAHGF